MQLLLETTKTWDEAVKRWLLEKAKKKSLQSDEFNIRWLNKYLACVPLEKIDRSVVATLKTEKMASGVSNATVNRMLALLRSILRVAVSEWDWISSAPPIKLLREPSRRIRYLSSAQAIRLLSELENLTERLIKVETILELLMRAGDVRTLR